MTGYVRVCGGQLVGDEPALRGAMSGAAEAPGGIV